MPDQIIDKVILFILYVRQLKRRNNYDLNIVIAMDETAVLKTAGHEKSKVTVTLAAKASSDKLKPYIVFPGHKCRVQFF